MLIQEYRELVRYFWRKQLELRVNQYKNEVNNC